jgi:hypothetical protein
MLLGAQWLHVDSLARPYALVRQRWLHEYAARKYERTTTLGADMVATESEHPANATIRHSVHNDSVLEVCRVQLSCMAPISDILARGPFQLGRGWLACRPALRKVEPTVYRPLPYVAWPADMSLALNFATYSPRSAQAAPECGSDLSPVPTGGEGTRPTA